MALLFDDTNTLMVRIGLNTSAVPGQIAKFESDLTKLNQRITNSWQQTNTAVESTQKGLSVSQKKSIETLDDLDHALKKVLSSVKAVAKAEEATSIVRKMPGVPQTLDKHMKFMNLYKTSISGKGLELRYEKEYRDMSRRIASRERNLHRAKTLFDSLKTGISKAEQGFLQNWSLVSDYANKDNVLRLANSLYSEITKARKGGLDAAVTKPLYDIVSDIRVASTHTKNPKNIVKKLDDALSDLTNTYVRGIEDETKVIQFQRDNQHWSSLFNTLQQQSEQDRKLQEKISSSNRRQRRLGMNEYLRVGIERTKNQLLEDNRTLRDMQSYARDNDVLQRRAQNIRRRQRDITAGGDSWASVAMLYGGFSTAGSVKDTVAKLQTAQLHLQGLNLTKGEQNRFDYGITNQDLAGMLINQLLKTPNTILTRGQATEAVYHASSAFGYFDYKKMKQVLPELVKTAQATKFAGYSTDDMGDIIRNYIGVIEARQQVNDVEAMRRTVDTIWRTQALTGGKVGPKDLEVIFRNLGSGASTITDEGLMGLIALAEQSKPAGGGSSGGAGSGVASVGTIVKMVQLMAAGKPVALSAKKDLYEAGLISSVEPEQIAELNRSIDELNKVISVTDLKKAGFTNKEQIWQDPIMGIAKMRAPLLEYMLSTQKNVNRYFGVRNADEAKSFFLANAENQPDFMKTMQKANQALSFLTGLDIRNLKFRGVYSTGSEKGKSWERALTWDEMNESQRREAQTEYDRQRRASEKYAFNTLFATMGFSHRVVSGMSLMTDADFLRRYGHTVQSAKNTQSADQIMNLAKETNNIDFAILNFQTSLERVYESFQPLVEDAAKFMNIMSDGLKVAAKFFGENSDISRVTLIAGGLAFLTKGMLAFVGAIDRAIKGSLELKMQLQSVYDQMSKNQVALLATQNKLKTHRANPPEARIINDEFKDPTSRRLRRRAREYNAGVSERAASAIPDFTQTFVGLDGSIQRVDSSLGSLRARFWELGKSAAGAGEKSYTAWERFKLLPSLFKAAIDGTVMTCQKGLGLISGFITGLLAKIGSIASGVGLAMMTWDVGNILWEWAKQSKTFNDQLERMQKLVGQNPNASLRKEIFETQTGVSLEEQKEELEAKKRYYEYFQKNQLPVWASVNSEGERTEFSVNENDSFTSNLKSGYALEAHQPGVTVHAGAYDAKNGTKAGYYDNPALIADKTFQSEVSSKLDAVRSLLANNLKVSLSPANDRMNRVQEDWVKNVFRLFKEPGLQKIDSSGEDYKNYTGSVEAFAKAMLDAEKSPDETVALRARLAASAVQTPIYDRLIDDSTLADPYLKGKFATDANDGVRSQFIQKILEIFREEAGDDDFKYYLKYFDPREWQRVRNDLVNQIVDAKKEGKDAVSEVLASSIVIGKQTGNVVLNPAEEAKAKRKQFYNPDVFTWVGQQETKYTGQYRSVREGRWDAETERKKAEDEITKRILEAPKDKEGRYKELLIDKNGELTIENIDTAGEAFKRLVDRMIKVFQSQEATSALKTLENSISRAKEEYEALSAVYTDDLDAKMTYIASAKKNAAAMLAKTSNGAEEQSSNEAAAADLVSLGAMNEAMKFLGETSSKIRDVRAASLEGEEKISFELRTANDELVNRAKCINEELLIGLDAFIAKKTSEFNESAKSQNWYSDPAKYSEEQQKLSDAIAEREDETKRLTELIRENTKKLQKVNIERANAEKKRQSLEMTKSLRASAERAKEDYELSENRVNNDFSQKLTTYTSASKSAKGMLESKKTEDPVERSKQQTAAGWMTLYASLQEANNWSLEQKSTIASAEKIGMTRREAADDEFQRSLREIENVTAEIAKTIVSERDQLLTRLQNEFDKEYGTLDKNSKKYKEAFNKLNQDKTLVKDLAERELTQNAQTGINARNAVSKNSTENKKWGLEKTLSDWYDLEKMTDQFTSSQPESFASAIEDALDGTKGTQRDYWQSILKDLRGMFLRHAMGLLQQGLGLSGTTATNGQALSGNTLIQGMTDGIMGLFGKKKTEATSASSLEFVSDRESAAVNAAVGKTGDTAKHAVGETLNGSASESLWDGFAEGMKEAFSSACDFLSDLMPDCIKNIDWRGIWGNVTSFLSDAMGFVMKGLSSMGSSAGSWAGSAASWIGSFFAEGGVMTPYGKATLQKYARGGIADRPQIALFGEGSMNEAYVPLPDGRSIPVTLSGSGTGGNVVNISIQVNNEMREDGLSSSNEVQSASGNAAGWNKFADSIKSMIVSEIANQSRPGGLLYDGHR